MGATSAIDALLVIFNALPEAEQEQALASLSRAHGDRVAAGETGVGRCLRSLQRVAEHLGEVPNSTTYRQAWRELKDAGEDAENLPTVIRQFGTWRQAREALERSQGWSPRLIASRFPPRRLDKIWRYTEETLRETMAECVEAIGHVPQVAEFEYWREEALELRRAASDDAAHIPSATPYRRRWKTWENALLHFGYTPDEVSERLERVGGAAS